MELGIEIWFTGRHLQVIWLHVKICLLEVVYGDKQLPIFILGPPSYLEN